MLDNHDIDNDFDEYGYPIIPQQGESNPDAWKNSRWIEEPQDD